MKSFRAIIILMLCYSCIQAQSSILWQKCYGGTGIDGSTAIRKTTDAGFVISGYSRSSDGDLTKNNGAYDCWIIKLDSLGTMQWQKSYGGSDEDEALNIHETSDGGYIVVGYTQSNDSDVTGHHGVRDVWILKLDSVGDLEWQKALGGTGNERAFSILQTPDLGYIVAGYSDSEDGDVAFNIDFQDFWIFKLSSSGTIQWQKSLGGTSTDEAFSIDMTLDGGYITAGLSYSSNGHVHFPHGSNDYWVVKLDSLGTMKWEKSLGGSQGETAHNAHTTPDGGYLISGSSESDDDDVTNNHGGYDGWIVKIDSTGSILWQKSIGGSLSDGANDLKPTFDGGYVLCGSSTSNDGDISGNNGSYDVSVFKISDTGILQWQESFGGTGIDGAESIVQTNDGGYVFAGTTHSNDGDVSGNHGNSDVWIVKLSATTKINNYESEKFDFNISPNPFSSETIISLAEFSGDDFQIEIRDFEGRLVKKLVNEIQDRGEREFFWNATEKSGKRVSNGIYFITLQSNEGSLTKKVEVLGR